MIGPKTQNEAKAYRYGVWAVVPNGYSYNALLCAAEVPTHKGSVRFCQCPNKNGKGPEGLFCGTHARVAERQAKGS